MIFVTVGTHEQGMDRLFKEIDRLIEEGIVKDEVFAQIGYTSYIPKNYNYKVMISYDEMDRLVRKSDIVITHGGPGSIFHPLQYEKIPIVIPRNPTFKEHVDDHQILFARRLESQKKILAVYDISTLGNIIKNYKTYCLQCVISSQNIKEFLTKFNKIINNL
ncbi:glycosyltransferase [Turicibacter sanguinis]|uniref:glycosyltransferase n=1 Tax=Turicibacter sanguinis TaxID=154288 RepID=UPI001899D306|nr:glycosyltransferase [Turicibacter sanguinis]